MVSQAPCGVNERVRCWRSSNVKDSPSRTSPGFFTDLPKMQTLTPLKSQKREGYCWSTSFKVLEVDSPTVIHDPELPTAYENCEAIFSRIAHEFGTHHDA
jgi:hypothetical protein